MARRAVGRVGTAAILMRVGALSNCARPPSSLSNESQTQPRIRPLTPQARPTVCGAIFTFVFLRRRGVGDLNTIDGQWKSGEDDMVLNEISIIGLQDFSQVPYLDGDAVMLRVICWPSTAGTGPGQVSGLVSVIHPSASCKSPPCSRVY